MWHFIVNLAPEPVSVNHELIYSINLRKFLNIKMRSQFK